MIKMLSAFTNEIDDADIAVSDILSQLQPDKNLLKNSIGIISCNGEFIETGVLKSISSALPFSTIGMETAASGITNSYGQLNLTVSVITSDDSEFFCEISEKIENDESVSEFCQKPARKNKEKTKMIFAFCPLNLDSQTNPENILNILNKNNPDIPVFGACAVSSGGLKRNAAVIFNGETFEDKFAFVSFCGKIEPKLFVRDIQMHKVVREKGLVTKSDKNTVSGINNTKFMDFLLKSGIPQKLIEEHLFIIPFWFDFSGNKAAPRSVFQISEDGSGTFSGNIPSGITMAIGNFTENDILSTAESIFNGINETGSINGAFLFSCYGRFVALGADFNCEMKKMQKMFGNKAFHLAYSAGEYLSDKTKEKDEYNWHSYSIIGFCF